MNKRIITKEDVLPFAGTLASSGGVSKRLEIIIQADLKTILFRLTPGDRIFTDLRKAIDAFNALD